MKYWVVLAISMVAVAGCRPMPYYFHKPEGPTDYQLGWEDGCDSKLSQGDAVYRLVYGYKKRPEMMDNQLYNSGWTNGWFYCTWTPS